MKILVYGINFAPELVGVGKYTAGMAEWLVAQGHDVRVVTAPPYYPEWRVGEGYSAERYALEHWSGASVWRCPVWIPGLLTGPHRIFHLASFAASSLPIMLWQIQWRPQVVWVVEPSIACGLTAWVVSRLAGARAWLHVQDFEVDAAFELGLLNGSGIRAVARAWERWLMRRFDRVSTISGRMLERLQRKGVAVERLRLFPNWTNADFVASSAVATALRAELAIAPGAVVALYSGTMGRKQGLEIMAQAAEELLNEPNLVFVFCGNGAGRDDLVTRCRGLGNVRFLDLQPVERVGALLGTADIHLLPQRSDAADLVMPSKLGGMLASGRPIVATCAPDTEIGQVVDGRGFITVPGDARAFAEAIRTLARNPELRAQLGACGLSYASNNLLKESVLAAFECELENLTQHRRVRR